MPVPTRVQPEKNIWVAAGDGDLERVQELVQQGLSPNVPDPNTYTPMHAAASYGHLHVLDYLISQGGDANVTDEDGDTPLYVVENVETARYLVERGAVVNHRNHEDLTPAAHLAEDFPEVAAYLESVSPTPALGEAASTILAQPGYMPSQHAQEQASEVLTSSLMSTVQEIMERTQREGGDPDAELREVVSRAVMQGVVTGYGMGQDAQDDERRPGENGHTNGDSGNDTKRSRTDEGPSS
ncbi:ankyrin repeat domain-containing protein [Phanerochaete sordida]|uniref:Ankyrin repeat domain-containing protein n=1 Tax=Phanerochaete sordida TaxID=48140 RepID=A0A9P3LIX2_9APHY|nr:ankyrin repeat domain-containing protein [Phanerochaete sordida]